MAETSGSAADKYIGSLISITSKSEIRYEGLLYNINTQGDSSISLQNVRCYGSEGRKKDGKQIPPSDEVYGFILFRGSDIKDLQVKSIPPVYTEPQIHNDPAIIQSHYTGAPSTLTGLTSIEGKIVADPISHGEHSALPMSMCPDTSTPYQTAANVGPWGSSSAPPSANGVGLPTKYWQGYYGPPDGLPYSLPQSMPLQSPAMPIPTRFQYPYQSPEVHTSFDINRLNSAEVATPLAPTIPAAKSVSNYPSSFASTQVSTTHSLDASLYGNSFPSFPTSLATNLLTIPPFTFSSNQVVDAAIVAPLSSNARSVPVSAPSVMSLPESMSSTARSSTSGLLLTMPPALVTPDQLLQPGPPANPWTIYPGKKDMEALISSASKASTNMSVPSQQEPLLPLPIPLASKASTNMSVPSQQEPLLPLPIPLASKASTKVTGPSYQEPLLPLPIPLNRQLDEDGCSHHSSRGHEQDKVRGNQFTGEFDFVAMNERFKKDIVWGQLGKVNQRDKSEMMEKPNDNYAEEKADSCQSKFNTKSVYRKDDFFDSISCNSLSHGARNERPNFSEQMKIDTETFGDIQRRPSSSRSIHGRGFRGNFRGSYYRGRGYGRKGRGRGGQAPG